MPRPALRPLLAAALLVAVLAAVYGGSLRGAFLWDDDLHITANPTIVGPLGLEEIWTSARANYFPLVLTNFWVQHQLWGLVRVGFGVGSLGFLLGAALWALHPVQVESAAWICELKNTQSAVFFLLAILCWRRWLGPAGPERNLETGPSAVAGRSGGARWYALTLGMAALAILSKPSTTMLPIALGLVAWWVRGRWVWREQLRLAPFFVLSAVAAGWTIWEQKFNSGAIGPEWNQTLPERFAIAGRAFWFYLGKLVWPEPLIFIYPRWDIPAGGALAYTGVAAALAFGAALVRQARDGRLRPLLFATAYFVALLFPILGFFSVYFFRYSFVGDHFQYLASMGPLALAGAGLTRLAGRFQPVVAAVLVAALGATTWSHTAIFRSSEALWRDTVAKNPAAIMAWLNLADTLAQEERHEEAIALFRHALTLRPDDPYAHNDLGCALTLLGRPAEAVPHLERSLALKPGHAEAHNNLGNALRSLGRPDEAMAQYRRALELKPAYTAALNNLGAELAETGRPEEALAVFEQARSRRADDAATLDNLGNALRTLGRFDEALARHREALAVNPAFAEAHANLGRTLVAAGRVEEALPSFRRALELRPGLVGVSGHLALALARLGRGDEALRTLEDAVARRPESPDARMNLGAALAQAGRPAEALPHFEAAVRIAPRSGPAQANLGTAAAALGRWEPAAAAFAAAAALQPENAFLRQQLAVALVNGGRLAEAVPEFEAALRRQPTPELHDQFAQVLRALGRSREALEQFEAAAGLRAGRR